MIVECEKNFKIYCSDVNEKNLYQKVVFKSLENIFQLDLSLKNVMHLNKQKWIAELYFTIRFFMLQKLTTFKKLVLEKS